MASERDLAGRELEVEQIESDLDQVSGSGDLRLETVRVDTRAFGEGYEAGLKQISDEVSRQLKELDKRWVARWAPQDLAIKNHERRIKALESRRPR